MENLKIRYRTWHKGIAPRPIKLEIPGWAGQSEKREDGARPQPWHCAPFADASTYGLELVYPFDTECRVEDPGDGRLVFHGDFTAEELPGTKFPPFAQFAPGHYGFTSSLDIQAPPGHTLRIEPHPRFYTDATGTCPVPAAGHLHTEWWGKIFFVAFKAPRPGETHVFRTGEAYAQILVVPKRVAYDIRPMTHEEQRSRAAFDASVSKLGKELSRVVWKDHLGNTFDDKYKMLKKAFDRGGDAAVRDLIETTRLRAGQPPVIPGKKKRQKKPVRVGRYVPGKQEKS